MAVSTGYEPVTSFEQWYTDYGIDERSGALEFRNMAKCADKHWRMFVDYKREMDARVKDYDKLEMIADNEVISPKPDLPNISSGETAGLVRRIARNLVQNTPNVNVVSKFDNNSVPGIFSRHILTAKIIGSDQYSNDMQQNLFCSTKTALTLGFDCVIPLLLEDAGGSWYMKYDSIHYRDVFPEPGVKDVREATCVYIRRYLTRGDVYKLIADNAAGWDIPALKLLASKAPRGREEQSVDKQTKKRGVIPDGYEIITWYSNSGEPFLTFSYENKTLLRIEKNKHPLKEHPVHFLVLEKDDQQPLGKSQVELLVGRQEFQDLFLNGAMKLWYRNVNPPIFGYGTVNAIPNLSPGKYTQIGNPNAKVEPFEVNTGTLMQFGQIAQQNNAAMVGMIGSADQQMAQTQGANGQGMSATPQGVDAQTAMVDITTNNYQKAIEAFFSHYCSYALTIYFQEMQAVKKTRPTAEAKLRLVEAGLDIEKTLKDGTLEIDFAELATEYWVQCVPGSLTELEDEKQLRILQQIFVPLSQAMPALASTQDLTALQHASAAMQYIVQKTIELSGSSSSKDLSALFTGEDKTLIDQRDEKLANMERMVTETLADRDAEAETHGQAIIQLSQQVSALTQNTELLLQKLGVHQAGPDNETAATPPEPVDSAGADPSVQLASA